MSGRSYGLWVYRFGVKMQGDGRKRWTLPGTDRVYILKPPNAGHRGGIGRWSEKSARRLAFLAANADLQFKCIMTLTYRALAEEWETDADRNGRISRQSNDDRHRFLRCLRREMGEYLWVREFQQRGVVHYHVLCEHEVSQERATQVWCRASGQTDDAEVVRHGVKVDVIGSQKGVRSYVGRYIGKEKQKSLPAGVNGAGRWWGASRSLPLAKLREVVWFDVDDPVRKRNELTVVRVLRRYLSKRLGWRYRGGILIRYDAELGETLAGMAKILVAHYGESPGLKQLLDAHEWDAAEWRKFPKPPMWWKDVRDPLGKIEEPKPETKPVAEQLELDVWATLERVA